MIYLFQLYISFYDVLGRTSRYYLRMYQYIILWNVSGRWVICSNLSRNVLKSRGVFLKLRRNVLGRFELYSNSTTRCIIQIRHFMQCIRMLFDISKIEIRYQNVERCCWNWDAMYLRTFECIWTPSNFIFFIIWKKRKIWHN